MVICKKHSNATKNQRQMSFLEVLEEKFTCSMMQVYHHYQFVLSLVLLLAIGSCVAFAPSVLQKDHSGFFNRQLRLLPSPNCNFIHQRVALQPSATRLRNGVIIDVDDNFFTTAFFTMGLFYSLGKAYNRFLLEEVAFEQRKMEARERRLEEDPTLSEMDLRREESSTWPSVYGRKKRGRSGGDADEADDREPKRQGRVAILERDEYEEEDEYGMSDDEIEQFEASYGVEYDPYYDEPYEESELPEGKFKEDKSYGDRRYANGEVFYKDETTGLFYRQGSKPRQKKFWNLNSS